MTWLAESEALHARVREAAADADRLDAARFGSLACDIARFQHEHSPAFQRLVAARGGPRTLSEPDAIPAVPVEAFRLARVAVHPPELDVVRFETSGTTGARTGVHAMRTVATYRALALAWGRRALLSGPADRVVVALAPDPGPSPTSSLGFMMRAFMEEWDAAALGEPVASRFLASPGGIDVAGLRRRIDEAARRGVPLLLLATSFSLVLLVDALGAERLPLPPESVVMQTGGFKGRTREVRREELDEMVSQALAVPARSIVAEYGMTELSSQLYEGTVPGAALAVAPGVLVPPPWLRVTPVDPASLEPVPDGAEGLARFVDLGNVDSAVAIVTRDVVRRSEDGRGIVLLGRHRDAEPRGCSLAIEEMVLGAGRS